VRKLVVPLLVVLLGATLWIGGELHRQNCVSQHRTGCSVLPWVQGKVPQAAASHYLMPTHYLMPPTHYLMP
jgi:hypothetical protein